MDGTATTLRSDTRSVTIAAPAREVFAFVADGANLSRWAIGFAKDVRPAGDDRFVVTTGHGTEVGVEIRHDAQSGTVDFHLTPAPGVDAVAYARVVPNARGSEFVFTQLQAHGVDDDGFDAQVQALTHELLALKALMEVACPI